MVPTTLSAGDFHNGRIMESVPVASVIRVLSLHHHPPGNPFPMKSAETLAFSGASLHNSLAPWSRHAFPSNFGLLRRKVPVRRPEVPRPALAPFPRFPGDRLPRSGKKVENRAAEFSTSLPGVGNKNQVRTLDPRLNRPKNLKKVSNNVSH